MRFKQIIETTTAGSVATVAKPMMTQTRKNVNVPGLKPVQKLMKGTKKKGPYANSIAESKVTEDDLAEQDLIVIPGQGRLRRTGFVKHDLDQGEHEGHTLKNSLHTIARAASELDERLSVQSEFPEWVSEKIGAAKNMMVTVMDYLISSQEMQHDSDAINELSSGLLGRAAELAKNKRDQAMEPELHNALGGGYMNPLATHYDDVSQKINNRAGQVRKKETIQKIASKIASPAVMRKIGVTEAFDLGDLRKAAASSRSPEDERALKRNPDFGKLMQKSVNRHNKAIVKTKQAVGSRIADIGAGGKEYNVKTDAAWDAAKKTVEEGWKSKLAGAALAGAAALGGGGAQAQNAPTGADNLPSIVAQIAFQVDGKSVTKDINLGTQYQTPGHASQAVKDFMKSKGIKFYNFTLQRVAAQPPLVTPDEMNASNQEYQRQHDSNNLSNAPYSAKGDEPARLQTDKGYTSSSRSNASIAYESKKAIKNKRI